MWPRRSIAGRRFERLRRTATRTKQITQEEQVHSSDRPCRHTQVTHLAVIMLSAAPAWPLARSHLSAAAIACSTATAAIADEPAVLTIDSVVLRPLVEAEVPARQLGVLAAHRRDRRRRRREPATCLRRSTTASPARGEASRAGMRSSRGQSRKRAEHRIRRQGARSRRGRASPIAGVQREVSRQHLRLAARRRTTDRREARTRTPTGRARTGARAVRSAAQGKRARGRAARTWNCTRCGRRSPAS